MHAVFRETRYSSGASVVESDAYREFNAIHAAQPGYRGSMVVDAGEGRLLTVTLWETAEAMSAAREALEPVVARLLDPSMTAPAMLLGTGRVVLNDLVPV